MARGRPVKSEIRQNVIDILAVLGKAYGYEIYKVYVEVFPKVTLRSIYYHLRKGAKLGEFQVNRIVQEKGEYSWGGHAEKTYYSLGRNASPRPNKKINGIVRRKRK